MCLALYIMRLGFFVFRTCRSAPAPIVRCVRVTPIATVRIVQEKSEAFVRALLGKFTDQVAFGRRVGAFEIRVLGFDQAKTVVMSSRDVDVLHVRIECQISDAVGVKFFRGETLGQLCIVGNVHLVFQLHPLAATGQRVQSVMQKQTKLRLSKPVQRRHPRIAAISIGNRRQIRRHRAGRG